MIEFTLIQQICIWALPLLFAITLHEAAHGYVAYRCGDNTAKMYGRLSLNPIHHIDPFGTIILPLLIGVLTHFNFLLGYAKPVPVNWGRLRHPKRDMMLVALAGPMSNILMAFLWTAGFKVATILHPESSMAALFLLVSAQAGVLINLILAFLNLIPIPPLDGSKILLAFLPYKQAQMYSRLEPYGFLILIALMFTNLLQYILLPLINITVKIFNIIYQL